MATRGRCTITTVEASSSVRLRNTMKYNNRAEETIRTENIFERKANCRFRKETQIDGRERRREGETWDIRLAAGLCVADTFITADSAFIGNPLLPVSRFYQTELAIIARHNYKTVCDCLSLFPCRLQLHVSSFYFVVYVLERARARAHSIST